MATMIRCDKCGKCVPQNNPELSWRRISISRYALSPRSSFSEDAARDIKLDLCSPACFREWLAENISDVWNKEIV